MNRHVIEQQTRMWGMFLHLSILAGIAAPIAGFAAPIVIWQIKRTELPAIDEHGKNAVNWIISKLLYVFICGVLSVVLIGIPLLIALGVVAVVFPIIAAIKANNGEIWTYPLAIRFLS